MRVREKCNFITKYKYIHTIKLMCDVLDISRSTYYKYKNFIDNDYDDYLIVKKAFINSKKTYGYRRITKHLKLNYGIIMNHKKVNRIMKKYNLRAKYIKKRKYKYFRFEENVVTNIVDRDFNQPNIWFTDITYLIIKGKRRYLSTILDSMTRKVITYKISKFNNNKLVMDTLNSAIKKTKKISKITIHSDQGSQYTSYEFKNICYDNGITRSMSRKGNPIDNAPIESFHSILKKETLYNYDIDNIEKLESLVIKWIKFYNTNRLSHRV